MDAYFKYFMSTDTQEGNLINKDKLIYSKFPDLKNWVEQSVINRTFGDPSMIPDTISSRDAIEHIEKIAKKDGIQTISAVIGGPPCQAYSLIGRGRMKELASKDDRNFFFRYYLDIVKEFRPKLFVFENVPGILTAQKGMLFPEIREEFSRIGYGFISGSSISDHDNIIECNNYGIYQTRKRLILFGYLKAAYPNGFTYPDFKKYMYHTNEPMTTENAISDLPRLHAGQGTDFWYGKYINNTHLSEYQKLLRKDSLGIANYRSRSNRKADLEIYSLEIAASLEGKKIYYSELPESLQFHNNRDKKVFEDRFRVHGFSEVPHTIVAHISKDGHYNIHPDPKQCRSLTVREAARIQSFPDNYIFEGPRTSQYVQVGNAVPPMLSRVIAKAVKDELRKLEGGNNG
jgi:DNA (cytosine-5)-methyltransferase 1